MSELDEDRAMENIVDRLSQRFPSLTRDHVQQVVDEEFARLEEGRIRDFVPVLVEHAAKKRLSIEAEPASIPVDESAAAAPATDEPVELDPMEIERRSRSSGFLFGDLGGGPT